MDVSQSFGETAGIHLGTKLRGMGVVVIEVFRCTGLALLGVLGGKLLVEEVGADVMDIDEGDTRLFDDLPIPASVGIIATLYPAVRPFVAWRE